MEVINISCKYLATLYRGLPTNETTTRSGNPDEILVSLNVTSLFNNILKELVI